MMRYIPFLIFLILTAIFYYIPIQSIDYFWIPLVVSSFLFAIFIGFLITRQNNRYNYIRDRLSEVDGNFSDIYRQFGHLGAKAQEKVKEIIKKYYDRIIKNKSWDYNLTHKSDAITSIHNLLDDTVKDKEISLLQDKTISIILSSLGNLQRMRKKILSLYGDRLSNLQWGIISFLLIILILSLLITPSYLVVYSSVVKGVFIVIILLVVIFLGGLNNLNFSDRVIREDSIRDVLDIFEGEK